MSTLFEKETVHWKFGIMALKDKSVEQSVSMLCFEFGFCLHNKISCFIHDNVHGA